MARSALDRDLTRAVSRQLLGTFAIGAMVLAVAAVGSTIAVPRLHAAGPSVTAAALGAAIGTGLTAVLPLAALAAAFAAAAAWSARGGAAGAASLGIGPLRQFAGLAPLWAVCATIVLVCAFALEPAAWTSLHRVRGGPLAAAVGWASLSAGEVRALADGGAAVLDADGLRATTGDRAWDLSAEGASPSRSGASWDLTGVTLTAADQTWTAASAEVRLKEDRRARWLAPPTSPWTLGLGPLLEARATSARASLVLHRRLALAAALPLLAAVGWLLAWGEAPRRRRGPGLAAAGALAVAVFVVARTADQAVADGLVGGAVGGWLPLLPGVLAASFLAWRVR